MKHRQFIVKQDNGMQTTGGNPGHTKTNQWYWHAKSAGKLVAWSGESYVRKAHAIRMAHSFAKDGDRVYLDDGSGRLQPLVNSTVV